MGLFNDLLGVPKTRNEGSSELGEDSCVDCEYFEVSHQDMFGDYQNYSYCKKKKMKCESYQRVCSSFVRER